MARQHPSQWKVFRAVHESEIGDFKDVPGTDGCYRVGPDGRVASRRDPRLIPWPGWWILLRGNRAKSGQPFTRYSLHMRDRVAHMTAGRIVLMAFVGMPPTETSEAAHKNGIADDNRLENLVWAEPVEVKAASIVRGTHVHGTECHTSRFPEDQVRAIREIAAKGVPVSMIARAMNVPQPRIRDVVLGDQKKHIGLVCPLTGRAFTEND